MNHVRFLAFFSLSLFALVVALASGTRLQGAAAANPPGPAQLALQVPRESSGGSYGTNYQGYIEKDDEPYTGSCDFNFSLDGSANNQKTYSAVPVREGHFTVLLAGSWIESWNGLYSLHIKAACPTGSAMIPLDPPQPVTAVPFARALLPGTILRSPTYGGCAIGGHNSRNDTLVLIACDPQGFRAEDLSPESADGGGGVTIHIGPESNESNTRVVNGIEVIQAHTGLKVEGSVKGFDILYPSGYGGMIHEAGIDGMYISSPGRNGLYVYDPDNIGVVVQNSGSAGVALFNPATHGFYVEDSGGPGISIRRAGNYGVSVEGSQNYDGVFYGDVYIGGSCSGCVLANFAVNGGQETLAPGTVVTVDGVIESDFAGVPVLLRVRPAGPGDIAIGVVSGLAVAYEDDSNIGEDDPSTLNDETSGIQPQSTLVPRDGDIPPGGYLLFVRDGLVRVRAGTDSESITAGTRLGVSAGAAVAVTTVSQATTQAMPPQSTIGIAVSEVGDDGFVWAMIALR